MVRPRVLPDDEYQVGLFEVVEGDAALADADRLGERCPGGLVAHVRAVRQVVGAERADEQLVDERRLVAGASRGVEDGLVGAVQTGQLGRDDPERVVPAHRVVVVVVRRPVHRLAQPALLPEPVAGAAGEVRQRMRGEELRRQPAQGRLLGDGLRPVLAELRGGAVRGIRVRPGAARAVEPVRLVEQPQGGDAASHPHLGHRLAERVRHPGHPRRITRRAVRRNPALVRIRHRRPTHHPGHLPRGSLRRACSVTQMDTGQRINICPANEPQPLETAGGMLAGVLGAWRGVRGFTCRG